MAPGRHGRAVGRRRRGVSSREVLYDGRAPRVLHASPSLPPPLTTKTKKHKRVNQQKNDIDNFKGFFSKKFIGQKRDIKNDKKHLVLQLTDRLKDVCDDQICWLKQDFIKELNDLDAQENTFRPEGPQGRFTWLNTTNIDDIMKQYENKYTGKKYGAYTGYQRICRKKSI